MEPTLFAMVYPPGTVGTATELGVTLAQLYDLTDHLAAQYSDEQIIASAVATWTAPVYGHFILAIRRIYTRDPITGTMVFDHILFAFTCKFDPTRCKMRTRKRKATGSYGTGNLRRAVRSCDKRRQVPDSLAVANQSQWQNSHIRLRALIMMWCAANQKPFDAIHDHTFLNIVHMLRPDAQVPNSAALSTDLVRVYNQVTFSIQERFGELDSGIHLAICGWPDPLTSSFIGVVVFWREGAKIWRALLDFMYFTSHYSGAWMAGSVIDCLARFGAVNRSFTSTFTRPSTKPRRIATNSRIRASELASGRHNSSNSAENPDGSGNPEIILDELDGILQPPTDIDEGEGLYDNGVDQKAVLIAINHMNYILAFLCPKSIPTKDLFPKICGFSNHPHESNADSTALSKIRETCKDSAPSGIEVPTDVDATRWEDALRCSEVFYDLRMPLEMLLSDTGHLAKYKLTEGQWLLNKEVRACMQVFCEPAGLLSQKETPMIHEVLPIFSTLKYRLERMRDNDGQLLDNHSAIRIAAQASLITLDEYVGIMTQSEVYLLATILCPYYKLEWFIEEGYDSARIEELRRMVYRHFTRAYPAPSTPTLAQPTLTASAPSTSPWMQKRIPARRSSTPYTPGQDWVTTYLGSPAFSKASVDSMGGVLNYWIHEQQRGSPLARIALDLLTAPGKSLDTSRDFTHLESRHMISKVSSVNTGRTFSGSRTAANYRQHQMELSTFRAMMAVGPWYGTPLLPEIDEVVDILNDSEN